MSDRYRPLLILGTRPEAIKMAPVILACQQHAEVDPLICLSGQHRHMARPILDYFGITPEFDLDVMSENQTLASLTAKLIMALDALLTEQSPDCIVAQGDTTTVMTASMLAFYRRMPFLHVEAGLRTGNLQAPWPEEFNRRVAGIVATLHGAPTSGAAENLRREGVPDDQILITGNTVVDALRMTIERERANTAAWSQRHPALAGDVSMCLITAHRRENFGGGMENICQAIGELASRFPETQFVYPVHLNPNVREPVNKLLGSKGNVHLLEPAAYPEFVWLMDRASVILTDSGGVQEEAASLGKPVVVMRDTTERPEVLQATECYLVGSSVTKIVETVDRLLRKSSAKPAGADAQQVIASELFGDGHAAERIVGWMLEKLRGA